MLPQANELSSQAVPGVPLVSQGRTPFIAYELAGVALQDPSQGLMVKLWTCTWDKHSGDFILSAPGVAPITLVNRSKVTEVSFSFDRNMNYVLAWVEGGQAKLKFYDSTIPGFTVWETELGNSVSPKLTHDDRRDNESAVDDVLLSYLRDGNLYYRQQRDRYGVEYLLASGLGTDARLAEFGMTKQLRMQWRVSNANQIAGAAVNTRPTLADIILNLCARVGISEQLIDVDDLWDVLVGGYLVASEQTPADVITQLQGIYFFVVCEYDGKVHFLARGHDPVASLTIDDLVERDNEDAITITDVQEVELLRKLTFNFNDMSNGLGTNNAVAERRAATVNAKAEQSTEAPISMYPDEALQTAQMALNAQWAERSTFEFTISQRHAYITPGDVLLLTDIRGDTHRIRMVKMTEQDGTYACEAITDAPWAYDSNWTAPTSPSGTGSDIHDVATEADIIVMNLPSWDGSDELGFYIASYDTPKAGCDVEIMADGALAVTDVGDLTDTATAGLLTAPLAAEDSAEYPSSQTLTVALLGDAEGLTQLDYDELLQYEHLAALEHTDGSWEILQFKDATRNADGTWSLSGPIRGRYNTNPNASAAGCRFVLLDSAVEFIEVAAWYKDLPLQIRAIAKNSTKDETWGWLQPPLSPWLSQTEWPPTDVSATRDGSNTVIVTWTPRPRLGVEVSPQQSQYFSGYRVTYSDGVTADVATDQTSHTRTSAPAGVTVTVAGLNSITGAGPASASIQT